ncbi:Heme NO binding protein [Lacunisphaera limnophila]|uniref:Heme NO binding protein n=1 Tax=Lacunisphaera limnophila TaxID=1838286 RepID=A0A1D8ASX1_9BACT|nr:heme NO-binding domain-containing protein [Lacunisphaera limnophila]AOS43994.1 Heme NO binding protein [Lacunisphaera limnophila]
MKGIVFHLLHQVVAQQYGEKTWDALLTEAGLQGAYTSLGSYEDAELFKIVGAASRQLGLPPNDIVRWFGRGAIPLLAQHYARVFTPHTDARSFVLTLNSVIHPEVRKMYPGADVPNFDFDTSSPEVLVMHYRSKRKMCSFAEGLLLGAADHFGESATIDHTQCMHRGDPQCELRIRFAPAGGA